MTSVSATTQHQATRHSAAKLNAAQLGKALAPPSKKADYVSESDYFPQYFTAKLPSGALSGTNLQAAMKTTLSAFFKGNQDGPITNQDYSKSEAQRFIAGLSEVATGDDASTVESAKAFGQVTELLKANLKDIQVVRFGPKDARTGKMASDQGLYGLAIVGKTSDGKLAGVLIGSVET